VTEAEAEGQADDSKPSVTQKAENAVEGVVAAVSDAIKPKKKKKNNVSISSNAFSSLTFRLS
jgi:hypothetical protein